MSRQGDKQIPMRDSASMIVCICINNGRADFESPAQLCNHIIITILQYSMNSGYRLTFTLSRVTLYTAGQLAHSPAT